MKNILVSLLCSSLAVTTLLAAKMSNWFEWNVTIVTEPATPLYRVETQPKWITKFGQAWSRATNPSPWITVYLDKNLCGKNLNLQLQLPENFRQIEIWTERIVDWVTGGAFLLHVLSGILWVKIRSKNISWSSVINDAVIALMYIIGLIVILALLSPASVGSYAWLFARTDLTCSGTVTLNVEFARFNIEGLTYLSLGLLLALISGGFLIREFLVSKKNSN